MIGKDSPKKVEFNGPFYGKLGEQMPANNLNLRSNQIGWERKIDGRIENYISTYNGGIKIPKNIDTAGQL
jgi:hypothetical protein